MLASGPSPTGVLSLIDEAVPRVGVVRARLIDLVDQTVSGHTVAISAPAGWGKSDLLTSWERHRTSSTPTAWITLEPGDDAPRRFWRRFLAALAGAEWSGREALKSMELAPDGEIEGEQIVRVIVDRAPADAALIIVIDDVHWLADGGSAEHLAVLLRHRPPTWQLVVSGRSLPLPLMRLRVARLVTAIGRDQLAFNDDEAATLFADAGCDLNRESVSELVACTGGWPAGLRLAAMPLSSGVPLEDVLFGVRSGQHDVERYFHEEVMGSLPGDVADFLLATCVSPLLDVRLARQLSGRDDAGQLLQSLFEAGIFTAPDRSLPDSFRYHPLLAESLERFLALSDPERHHELHRVAARWHREHGAPDVAFHHAAQSEDWDVCTEVIDHLWIPMFVGGDVDGLADLLGELPRALVSAQKPLRALNTLVLLDRSDTGRIADEATVTPSTSRPELVLAMESARRAGRVDVARCAADAILSRLPHGDPASASLRCYVLLSLGVAEYWASDRPAAERDLRLALIEAEHQGLDYLRLGCLSQLVGVLTAQNRVNDAAELAAEAAAFASERGWERSGWAAELWHALGWINYLRGDLAAAEDYLDRAEQCVWHQDAVVGAIIPTIKALVARLAGRISEAKAFVDLASARLPAARAEYVFLDYIDAELVRYAVWAGELGRARQLLARGGTPPSLHHCVAHAELLMAERRIDRAGAVLRRGLDEGEGYLDQRVHAMVLLAALEPPSVGRAVLIDALRLAAPERIVQPFCQVGASIMPMLGDIGRSNRSLRAFTTEIRERFAALGSADLPTSDGPDSLTPRELDVLRMLDSHDTLAEVAARLHVSANTLKVHTRHVYDKLGVGSRRDAVLEGTRRGLL